MQLGCRDEELWIDSSRGVICHGPKGPSSSIPGGQLKFNDLPPTAELLQEEVLVRFLASHKSKKADDAFMAAMYYASIGEDVPERVDRPTIFTALTKTSIAVANNAWTSRWDNLVDQMCLENGLARFRLDEDGLFELILNWDVIKAWLSQAWSVFHACGVSLKDGSEDFKLVYPYWRLQGNIDKSPLKSQQRQQQPIYLFIYPPLSNLSNGKTSSFHYWSCHEDGHSHISPESCHDLGLPVELLLNARLYAHSWRSDTYKLTHQYQALRGFNPTTVDFARHLGYHNILQPLDDSDRFEDAQKDQTSPPPDTPTDHGGSLNIIDSEHSSDIPDPIQAEDTVFVGGTQDREGECNKSSYHDTPNKRRKTDFDCEETENCKYPHQILRHKDDATCNGQCMMDAGLRPIRPLPARNPPSPIMDLPHYIQRGTSASQLPPLHHNPPHNQVSYHYPPLPTGLSSRGVLSHYGSQTATASIHNPLSLPTCNMEKPLDMRHITELTSFDTTPPFNPYSMSESAYPINNPTTSTPDSPYADPSTYSVGNAAYAAGAGYSSGWPRDWQHETPNYRPGPPFIAADNSNPFVYRPSIASTSTFFPPIPFDDSHASPTFLARRGASPSEIPFKLIC
ncbi:hypothetical protein PQX77_012573 [Marasmius sp. AFHP31]|nr:hypothetical protein PQX77_012573 [Marasmius sp. AFHP31]